MKRMLLTKFCNYIYIYICICVCMLLVCNNLSIWCAVTVHTQHSKVHRANIGPTWVLSAPDGHHVGPVDLAIRGIFEIKQWPVHMMHWIANLLNLWLDNPCSFLVSGIWQDACSISRQVVNGVYLSNSAVCLLYTSIWARQKNKQPTDLSTNPLTAAALDCHFEEWCCHSLIKWYLCQKPFSNALSTLNELNDERISCW